MGAAAWAVKVPPANLWRRRRSPLVRSLSFRTGIGYGPAGRRTADTVLPLERANPPLLRYPRGDGPSPPARRAGAPSARGRVGLDGADPGRASWSPSGGRAPAVAGSARPPAQARRRRPAGARAGPPAAPAEARLRPSGSLRRPRSRRLCCARSWARVNRQPRSRSEDSAASPGRASPRRRRTSARAPERRPSRARLPWPVPPRARPIRPS